MVEPMSDIKTICSIIVFAPLVGAVLAGMGGRYIGRAGAHTVTIAGVSIACLLSIRLLLSLLNSAAGGEPLVYNETLYTWLESGGLTLQIGFLIDRLSATMMVVVTFVSLMVHIYTIGYMREDPGYQRFFSYISLFTFAMLMLVMANNFLQLFFGWEGVGLVSYLLIGFWYTRDSAIFANMKAFLVNRIGDMGMVLGIASVAYLYGSLDFNTVFAEPAAQSATTYELFSGKPWSAITVTCILLFIGAMAKSAQFPLHVWLPDSMEGPTPISALIHAATMVTAGIFLLARTSPLFELSETALSFVMIIGAITALFMGFLGIVQHDIKRVIAYSTLSQLGYMTVALGASAYAAGIFHLTTHAFFKALLFLAAGSVIIAMHHEQDMRKMGGLRKYMPITYITCLIGTLALVGFPGFAGFFSKDAIIEAVKYSQLPGAGFAYVAVLGGVFVTALYSFRLLFLVFHGPGRMDDHTRDHLHETPLVVTGPLILLAIPSVIIGAIAMEPMLFGGYFGDAIVVAPNHQVLETLQHHWHGSLPFILHGFTQLPFFLMLAGLATAWWMYMARPELPARVAGALAPLHRVLSNNYYLDRFNQWVFAGGLRGIGQFFWKIGDVAIIDGLIVNGSARAVGAFSGLLRHIQTGYLYHYAFAMMIGLMVLMSMLWFVIH